MKNTKRHFFIIDFAKSIKNFDYYKEIADEKISKSLKYFFKLVILYSVILSVCTIINVNKGINEFKNLINTEISDLNYSNGILHVNNDESKTLFNKYVIIDTSKDELSELENKAQVVIGKEYCTVKMDEHILKIKYNDYMLNSINAKFYIPAILIIIIWVCILMTISTITDVLVIALIGYIISKIINKKFSFTNTFNIAVHAITLPVLLGAIYYVLNIFTGFYMKYFSIMYTSIATIYMMTSILLITSDNNENNNIQDD